MKRLSQFLVLALIVGAGFAAFASAETIRGCEIKPGTECWGADLRDANLFDAHLEDAVLVDADLRGAHMEAAHMSSAYLNGANMNRARLDGADLEHAHLPGAQLESGYLYGARLNGASLEIADLKGARLNGADLRGADLRNANLRGADFLGANLRSIQTDGATFCHTIMPDGTENNSDCGAQLRGTNPPEPRLGEWQGASGDAVIIVTLQVQWLKVEIDNGRGVTRDDHFRLADITVVADRGACRMDFGAVRIGRYGHFADIQPLDHGSRFLSGDVVNPTEISLDIGWPSDAECPRTFFAGELHPVGAGVAALASAETINGCEIVENPTAAHHTSCPHADLRGAHLNGADLANAYLPGADLEGAYLQHADLNHAVLADAHLSGAHLEFAKGKFVHLYAAFLRGAHLEDANLDFALLSHARLEFANLRGAHLNAAYLQGTDLSHANLEFTDLNRVIDLRGAKFCHTTMPDGSENNRGC